MGRWIERKSNWLKNDDYNSGFKEKTAGRPPNDSEDYGVKFIPLRCPRCKSKSVLCYKTDFPIRYHTCQSCGWKFKSIEEK